VNVTDSVTPRVRMHAQILHFFCDFAVDDRAALAEIAGLQAAAAARSRGALQRTASEVKRTKAAAPRAAGGGRVGGSEKEMAASSSTGRGPASSTAAARPDPFELDDRDGVRARGRGKLTDRHRPGSSSREAETVPPPSRPPPLQTNTATELQPTSTLRLGDAIDRDGSGPTSTRTVEQLLQQPVLPRFGRKSDHYNRGELEGKSNSLSALAGAGEQLLERGDVADNYRARAPEQDRYQRSLADVPVAVAFRFTCRGCNRTFSTRNPANMVRASNRPPARLRMRTPAY
jgi:hypothetical protein